MKTEVDWQFSENHWLSMSLFRVSIYSQLVATSWINAFQWDEVLHSLTSDKLIFHIQWDSYWNNTSTISNPNGVSQSCRCARHTTHIWWQMMIYYSAWMSVPHEMGLIIYRDKNINKVFKLKKTGLTCTINALLHIQNSNVSIDNWTQTLRVN
jgi:hypothetical protein